MLPFPRARAAIAEYWPFAGLIVGLDFIVWGIVGAV